MFQHFWLICGLWCGLGNASLIFVRRRKYVELGLMTEEEVVAFAKGMALWIVVPCLVFWVLQLSIGADIGPMYLKWPDPQRMVAVGFQVLLWLVLVFWVFIRDGAKMLSAFFSVGGRGPSFLSSPVAIKVGTAFAITASIAALLGAHA
jgi:hypothetical protein